jgi:DNA-directed RNA polymerase alpha subunit
MINKVFFERFTAKELEELRSYIDHVKKKREGNLPMKVRESDVSARCKDILFRHGVKTWVDLTAYSDEDVHKFKRMGSRTLKEMYLELEKRGLELRS